MPTTSSNSSSVFGRLTGRKSHVLEIKDGNNQQERFNHSPPADALSDSDRNRLLSGHRRESSIPSIRNSVTDLGSSVRRSVSLRSHRTQHSTSTLGRGPRQPSSSNLLSQTSPTESPTKEDEKSAPVETPVLPKPDEEPAPPAQHPLRSRGKLSISARSFSNRFKSTDTLVIPGQLSEGAEGQPPLPSPAIDQPKNFSMLVAAPPPPPAIPKRAPPDRPSLASQASFASSQSQANGVHLQHIPSVPIVPSGGHNPNLIHQSINETSNKRMATIDYLRKVHEGNVFYFSTLHYTSSSLNSSIPSLHPHKQGRRATSYLSLGYSLPLLLEMNSGSPTEYLKALSALLSEFETYQSLAGNEGGTSSLSRARVGQMFKTGMGLGNRSGMRNGRRSSAATDSIALDTSKASMLSIPGSASDGGSSPSEMVSPIGHDFNHLLTPHLPFDPDFNTTFATLCDTLIDIYANLLKLVSQPETCTPLVGEAFSKADKSIRKILVANITREFEDTTRQGVKTEVAGLGRLVLGGLM
ncbi:hypothetical protein LTR78_008277 [Recurvomyces mirabilis]|uniref:Uncharacterized protein n=1 Tax=Recurvomyces mirabilis TaxID=574656 RepID=A0AAE0WH25_9PEZI|nr:hypothetical protein LTR78_008277 [Recurvomyces mirabilis]KAK5156562.1 hypothetical protein LTS14_004774 [Recurvomyces mirabilis]